MLIRINIVLFFIDYTICSLSGRPYTPLPRVSKDHPLISEEDLIKKKGLLDPLADYDDIDWKTKPFDKDAIVEQGETPEQLMSMITFEGSSQLQTRLRRSKGDPKTGGCTYEIRCYHRQNDVKSILYLSQHLKENFRSGDSLSTLCN